MKTAAMRMRAILVLLAAASAAAAAASRCHTGDKAALLAIKAALGNPYHFASWTAASPCCDWYDVDCDASTGRVVGLSLFQDANLTGAIPDAVAGLAHLRSLRLHHLPGISSPIPLLSLGSPTSPSSLFPGWPSPGYISIEGLHDTS